MKEYIDRMQKGTTRLVVQLRLLFLGGIGLLILLHVGYPYVADTISMSPFVFSISEIVLGAFCAILGPIIAWKDPAMTMKMFGGIFSIFFLFLIFDIIKELL